MQLDHKRHSGSISQLITAEDHRDQAGILVIHPKGGSFVANIKCHSFIKKKYVYVCESEFPLEPT